MSIEKPIYHLIDGRGRVYIPKELRVILEMQPHDIIRIIPHANGVFIRKVTLIEVGDHSKDAQQAYTFAAFKGMNAAEQNYIIMQLVAIHTKNNGGKSI